jgi:hypothetical protein
LPSASANAVEEADEALGHRAQVVECVGSERDLPERATPGLVDTGVVALERQSAASRDQEPVQAAELAVSLRGIDPVA